MRPLISIGLFAVIICGCGERTVNDVMSTDEFVHWAKDQNITYDMFLGKGSNNAYSAWVGFYFIYDIHKAPDIRFNVTTFLDRTKSYTGEINDNTDSIKYKMFERLYKLKFDHFEIYARRFRKHLIENKEEFTPESDDKIRPLSAKFFNQADSAWTNINDEIERNNDYTEEHFSYLRKMIDIDLETYKEFDDSKNNFDVSSSR
jgi:hypothetical protein